MKVCEVCNESFLNRSWYHCPRCHQHGYASMYGDRCTGCSNYFRFGHPDPLKVAVEELILQKAYKELNK